MAKSTDEPGFCAVYASIEILQEKWSLHVIRALLERAPLGFNELRRTVDCNPATLTQRLEHLEKLGIVTREVHSVMPPKTSYGLTQAGVALNCVVKAIDDWGRKYLDEAKGKKGTIQVKRTGKPAAIRP
jgi:DNA-binding HxlR family transcriptional regulator